MDEGLGENVYREIKRYAITQMVKTKDAGHDDKHVIRVKNNTLRIVKMLGVERKIDKNLLKAICLLHDFTYTVRKPSIYTYIFEGHIEKRIIRSVLAKFDLSEGSKEVIVNAVFRHAHSFPFKRLNRGQNIYTKIVQDADTLDYFDCLRIKKYMGKQGNGILGNLKRKLGGKLIEYGMNNLGSFLNYPVLAKSFLTDSTRKCL